MEQTTVINFDPEVNATLLRIFELEKAIDTIKNSEDTYFSEDEEFGLSLLLNMEEEVKFLKTELKKVWESIPEMDVDKHVEEMFTGESDEE